MILALAGSAQASAPATPGQLAGLAAWHEGQIILAADGNLTFSVKSIDAEPGIEAPIAMILPSAAELRAAGAGEGTFLLIRNIPEGVSVSAGMATGRVWVVPLREAPTLRLLSKPGASAQFQLGFHLIGPNNRVLAETTVPVTLRPIQPVVAVGPAIPPRPETPLKPPAQTRPQAEPLSPQAEAVLLARGREVLEQGGIAAARIIFEELATHGSAAGALALARSYDPAYAGASRGSAPPPNLAEARKWYERAAELGNPDAKRRLAEIASGG
ncbi:MULTISPECIES: SEL1-like repeat protein [Rhodomicrobium]|uniref:SEL1-like repeat protein n=1 Tax=Rhodomicrobium TaxID=1068 RepID=UPI000B4BEDBB|nr:MULTISPECIES: SEL1-like repeat protein [Rhodomicrobium]